MNINQGDLVRLRKQRYRKEYPNNYTEAIIEKVENNEQFQVYMVLDRSIILYQNEMSDLTIIVGKNEIDSK